MDLNEPIATRIWTIREGRTTRVKTPVPWDSDEEDKRMFKRRYKPSELILPLLL
jgi:hypothetical protein